MSKFQSAVLTLPPDIKTEVDQLIESNSSGQAIYRSLVQKYGSQVKVPSLPTIIRYIRYYNSQKQGVQKEIIEERLMTQFQDGVQEIDNLLARVSKVQDDTTFNKVRILEGLVAKCLLRMQNLELSQEGVPRPNTAVESAISKYITDAKGIIESIIKLSASLQQDQQAIVQIIHTESTKFLEIVRDVVLEVCPDKYDQFTARLEDQLKTKSITITTTATTEVNDAIESFKEEYNKHLNTAEGLTPSTSVPAEVTNDIESKPEQPQSINTDVIPGLPAQPR